MIDELNKYAPREGSSPIKEVLLDIAERGRSLGIILIGAQQTASEVERRIVSNSAIRVVGRLDPAEAGAPSTGSCPPPSGPGPRWPSRAPCSSRSPRSRFRSPSSSPSRPGPPGWPNAPPPARERSKPDGRPFRGAAGRQDETSRPSALLRRPAALTRTPTEERSGAMNPAHLRLAHRKDPEGPRPAGRAARRPRRDRPVAAEQQVDAVRSRATCTTPRRPRPRRSRSWSRALLALARPGRGHRHRRATTTTRGFRAYRPLMDVAGITLVGTEPRARPTAAGCQLRRPPTGGASSSRCCRSSPRATP